MLKVPCGSERQYHSQAARDDRAGTFPLSKDTSGRWSRFACSQPRPHKLRITHNDDMKFAATRLRRLSASGKQGGTVGRLTSSAPHP